MKLRDKILNKIGYFLLSSYMPILKIVGIYLIEKNNLYMENEYIKYKEILNVLKNHNSISITGTGVLLIFFKNEIIKFPLGRYSLYSLDKEYSNYLLLKKSNLKGLVDYRLEYNTNCYKVEKLFEIKYPIKEYRKVLLQLINEKNNDISIISFLKEEIISNSIEYIRKQDNNICSKDILNLLKSKKTLKSFPMHGDLTQFNMMKNNKDNLVIIDLDRFCMEGVENIDRIHFLVEYYAKKRKIDFFAILTSILENKNISNKYFYFLFFYYIYRIGAENSKHIKKPFLYNNNILKVLNLFLEVNNRNSL